jgi:hypothetical protein
MLCSYVPYAATRACVRQVTIISGSRRELLGLVGAVRPIRGDRHGLDEQRQQLILDALVHLPAEHLHDSIHLEQRRHVRGEHLGQVFHAVLQPLLLVLEQVPRHPGRVCRSPPNM